MTAPVVAFTLIFYGVMFILVENYNKNRRPAVTDLNKLSYKTAFIIGLFQVLSLVPGTSRSGSTILGGILFGASRYVAGIYLLPGNSSYVWCQPAEAGKIRFSLHWSRNLYSGGRYGYSLCGIHYLHQVPAAVYQEQ